MRVLALLATGFEDLEALGTIALLRRANIAVDLCSVTKEKWVVGKHGIKVEADVLLEDVDPNRYGMIFLPGGIPGVPNLEASPHVINLIQQFLTSKRQIAAICAAPGILGRMGVLKDVAYTCFPGVEMEITEGIHRDVPVIVGEQIITGRAAGSVIDFALAIIEQIKGREAMLRVKETIHYE